ncbi:hypothetical protein [Paraburkholderia sp. ZP32-5]|uniref:hypothetical protein n=1 Tax=Paraburkholderia sp. ZP32-5 TaxID=2883245 RepID=UPI001F2F80A7|nr:hypothetical protein [Paraburkholderia sp. ZP32-5]
MAETAPKKIPRKAGEKRKYLRDRMWPDVPESKLWLRSRRVGFTTLPRTMPLIARILNLLSDKGFPLSDTYLTLWCWVFDEAFLEIRNPREFAFESGFGGPRAEATWNGRMKRLEELGFIRSKVGPSGDFAYVLLLNPIQVIDEIYKTRAHDQYYTALLSRLIQIGADDLEPEEETPAGVGVFATPGAVLPSLVALSGLPPFGPLPSPAAAGTPPGTEVTLPPPVHLVAPSVPLGPAVPSALPSAPTSAVPSAWPGTPDPSKKTP